MKFSTAIFKTFFLSLCMIANVSFAYAQTASILPPAKTTFTDQNGKPLTSGTVDFYVPGTTTRKTTWQDSGKGVPNTNPVVLDAAGRALIWGDGSYRQVVKDRNGNQIWDQVTSSIGSGGSSGSNIGDGLPVGTILPTSAIVAPANYQFAYGQTLLRSAYPELLAAVTIQTSIGCVGGSPLVNVTDTSSISVGTVLESICVAGSPTVISKTSSSVTLSANSTITVSTTARFFLYGNGDALTTFNVPDMRGYVAAGRCNMGGVDCSVLNSTYFSTNSSNTPSGLNAKGGNQSGSILKTNIPNYALTVVDPGHFHSVNLARSTSSTYVGNNNQAYSGSANSNTIDFNTNSSVTNISVNSGGSGTPISLVQPTLTLNYVIKVTPDTNLTASYGVAAIGGMTGLILCGSNVICSGNTISFNWSGVNSIQGMSGDITCGAGLTCSGNSISANSSASQVITSREAAKLLDLSIYTSVKTLGYYTGGDGGGATFVKANGSPWKDAYATNGVISGGSGYVNGTYRNVPASGGTCQSLNLNVTVSGGAVSAVTIVNGGQNGCVVGDVTTVANTFLGGSGSGFTYTITAVVGPLASFTDAAGNKFQYVVDEGNFINLRQFGAKMDWSGTDAIATDDTLSVQSAMNFASINCTGLVFPTSGGCAGQTVIVPKGTSYFCTDTLIVPYNVHLKGQGRWSSTFKLCDTGFQSSKNFVEICDKTTQLACFNAGLSHMQLNSRNANADANIAVVYSNNVQDELILDHVYINAGQRSSVYLETGYGGASYVDISNLEIDSNATNDVIRINYGTTIVNLKSLVIANSSNTGPCMRITGGFVDINGFHPENCPTAGLIVNIPTSLDNGMVRLHGATGNSLTPNLVQLSASNHPGNFIIGTSTNNGSTNIVQNGQPAGSNRTTPVVADMTFNP